MKKLLYIIPIFILFASCEKIIEFDVDGSQSLMVVNAVPSAGQQMFVYFSQSRFFLDNNNSHPIEDVDMQVLVNGVPYSPTSIQGCKYFFGYTLQEDDQLDLQLKASGQLISSHTYVPRIPQITPPTAHIDTTQAFTICYVNFNLQDHADYSDYYMFTISRRDSGLRYRPYFERYDTIDTVYNTMFFCADPGLLGGQSSEGQFSGSFSSQLRFTDALIDGQNHNTTLMMLMLVDTNEVAPFIHEYTLNVETVTPARYRYLSEVARATSVTQYFTEPAEVYSNVTGAYGIFAGNAKRSYPLTIDTLPGSIRGKSIPLPLMKEAMHHK